MAAFDGAAAPTLLEDLDKPGADNSVMRPYWQLVDAILGGVETMRLAKDMTLPQLPAEDDDDYKFRVNTSKFTNVFGDIIEDLSSRPFSEEVKVEGENTPAEIEVFCDDVDGAGTSLTMFAAEQFYNAVAYTIDWTFVDFPNVPPKSDGTVRTREDDKRDGNRPYWSHVRAINVLEVRTKIINGRETIIYFRLFEPAANGIKDRVRIMELINGVASWKLYEKSDRASNTANATTWVGVDEGIFSIGSIPLYPFATGRRKGRTWQFHSPMKSAAELQVQLFQDESALKHSKIMSAFVMIAANGVKPEKTGVGNAQTIKPLKTGPGRVLYGGVDGSGTAGTFELLEPSASTMEFQAKDNERTINQLRELGRQPLTAQSGNLTVITTTVAAMKGNSACQQWAIIEGKALESALEATARWYGIQNYKPSVEVFHDFDVDGEGKDMTLILDARKNGDLSQGTLWHEMRRRGVLSAEFDPENEKKALLDETPDETDIDDEITKPGANVVPIKQPVKPPV